MPKEVAPVGADITPELADTVAKEIKRRIFALRVATEEEVISALRMAHADTYQDEIIKRLAGAQEPVAEAQLRDEYEQLINRNTRTHFLPQLRNTGLRINNQKRVYLHLDNPTPHSRYNAGNRLWTLASINRPLKVIPTISPVVQGWHFATERIAKESTGELKDTLEACIGEYAALPVNALGDNSATLIAAANERLGESNLQIHAHRGYALIGDDRPGYNLYFVDSEATRTRLACNLS